MGFALKGKDNQRVLPLAPLLNGLNRRFLQRFFL